MDRREVAAVLAYIGRLDPRTARTGTDEACDQIAQWHELLSDVSFATAHGWDVREAIRAHVLDSPYPILPVDVARKWRAHRRDRLDRHTDPTPAADPDNPAAWRTELLRTRHAVATGMAAPSPHRQLTGGPQAEPGWHALAGTLADAEANGHDPATLLTEAAARRELDTAESISGTLVWRLRRMTDLPADPAVTASQEERQHNSRPAVPPRLSLASPSPDQYQLRR
ncbi:hypothetical protein ACIP79_05835 [Streptomyces sp. NPDC088747]|uniref:hypothetical protein n=1 Tax=Streptomyces sp. NPDC088747 TaxID=3365886 RepID=UPI003803F62A